MKKVFIITAILLLSATAVFGNGYDDFRVSATIDYLVSKPNDHIFVKNVEGTVVLHKKILYQGGYSGIEYSFFGKSGKSIFLFLPDGIPLIPDGTKIRVLRGDWGKYYPGRKTYLFGWKVTIL